IPMLTGGGYKGEIFPVNPNREAIGSLKCYPALESIQAPCDVALIAVPAKGVPDVVASCGRAGIPYAIVLSAGFGEVAAEGIGLEKQLIAAAKQGNVRLVGPNCQGVINLKERMFSGFGTGFDEYDAPYGP